MADDTNPTPALETASVDESSKTKAQKMRAPRKLKAGAEAVADTSMSAPVKKQRGQAKKAATYNAPVIPVAATPAAATPPKKSTASNVQPSKPTQQQVETAIAETDGFAELLKLEEENQKLRKALSEKLRAENADLRKKLGLA